MTDLDQEDEAKRKAAGAAQWQKMFIPEMPASRGREGDSLEGGSLESLNAERRMAVAADPLDRIAAAREAMRRAVRDRFGGDAALLAQVDRIAVTGEEAVAVLLDSAATELASEEQSDALETVVAFDGSRPSFLVVGGAIDFASSYNTDTWRARLAPYLDNISAMIGCVGRVEIHKDFYGTAFLVAPTLAITNRHVAEAIAMFGGNRIRVKPGTAVDFGREAESKASFDRRKVEDIVFAGADAIDGTISHANFDIAVLRLSPSSLGGEEGRRRLSIGGLDRNGFDFAEIVATVGYPTKPFGAVPQTLQAEFGSVLSRLLEGDGGAKRFAPGQPSSWGAAEMVPDTTACHDATTLKGNSGSPLFSVGMTGAALTAGGLHYGGSWRGERTNWAHLLALTGGTAGLCGTTFADFCTSEGINLQTGNV